MFFKKSKISDESKVAICVLDKLLQIKLNGDAINKSRNIDLELYGLLNITDVNKEVIHLGLIPVIKDGQKLEKNFLDFIQKLHFYSEYEINHDYYYFNYVEDLKMQKIIITKVTEAKHFILDYIYKKGLLDESELRHFKELSVKGF